MNFKLLRLSSPIKKIKVPSFTSFHSSSRRVKICQTAQTLMVPLSFQERLLPTNARADLRSQFQKVQVSWICLFSVHSFSQIPMPPKENQFVVLEKKPTFVCGHFFNYLITELIQIWRKTKLFWFSFPYKMFRSYSQIVMPSQSFIFSERRRRIVDRRRRRFRRCGNRRTLHRRTRKSGLFVPSCFPDYEHHLKL